MDCASLSLQVAPVSYHCLIFFIGLRPKLGNTYYHIIFNVRTPSLEARNIRLVNIITYVIEESKLISENMSANVISLPWRRFWEGAGALPLFPDARPFLMGFIGALPFLVDFIGAFC